MSVILITDLQRAVLDVVASAEPIDITALRQQVQAQLPAVNAHGVRNAVCALINAGMLVFGVGRGGKCYALGAVMPVSDLVRGDATLPVCKQMLHTLKTAAREVSSIELRSAYAHLKVNKLYGVLNTLVGTGRIARDGTHGKYRYRFVSDITTITRAQSRALPAARFAVSLPRSTSQVDLFIAPQPHWPAYNGQPLGAAAIGLVCTHAWRKAA